MDESSAWIRQANADRQAAESFSADELASNRCHAIAKCQQTVEKAIKAIVSALHDAGVFTRRTEAKHGVTRYVQALVRLPRAERHRSIQSKLHGLLDQTTRAAIEALDDLAPQNPPRRNTEYPFQDAPGQWTFPAAEHVFSMAEAERFRELAFRVLSGATRVISAIRRGPR